MIGKIKGIGGVGGSNLNVFAQLAEPKVKDGIWIKTEEVITDEPNYLLNIPYDFYNGSAVTIGTDIYLFGGEEVNTDSYKAYKYDTIKNIYTQLADIPYSFRRSSAVAIGTNIYLFGSGTSLNDTKAYKYDTTTNTYAQLTNVPYTFYSGSTAVVGTDIYLLGSGTKSYSKYAYKYNTITNTYTKLADIPAYYFSNGAAVAIGTNIYLFGGKELTASVTTYQKKAYKYDTLTNTYTQLTDIPYYFYNGSAVVIDTNIYLFGGLYGSQRNEVYKYDTLANTYIQLTNIPYMFWDGSAVVIGTDIYLLGGGGNNYQQTNYMYNTYKKYPTIDKYKYNQTIIVQSMPTTPENNDIYIIYGSTYATKLLEQMIVNFASVSLYKDNEAQLYPIYYGNGTNWIKILN